MYDKFTDRARKVMQLANQEAQRFNHEALSDEHILLGLIKEGSGVACNVLKNLDVDLSKVRLQVASMVQPAANVVTMGAMPLSISATKLIQLATEESDSLKCDYIGTEHLLLGLLKMTGGAALQVLTNLGVVDELRKDTLFLLGIGKEQEPEATKSTTAWRIEIADAREVEEYEVSILRKRGKVVQRIYCQQFDDLDTDAVIIAANGWEESRTASEG